MPRPDYETVDDRLHRFKQEYPDSRIVTTLLHHDADRVVFKAEVWRHAWITHDGERPMLCPPDAVGHAEESRAGKPINENWAMENCETSALGRALANLGLSPRGARPSIEEMGKRARETAQSHPALKSVPDKQARIDEARKIIDEPPPERPTGDMVDTEWVKSELEKLKGDARGKARAAIKAAGLPSPLPDQVTPEQLDVLQALLIDAYK